MGVIIGKEGKTAKVDEWMAFLNNHMKDTLLTLENEKMYVETIFREILDGCEYLYWYSFLEDKYYALNTAVDKAMLSNFFKKGFIGLQGCSLTVNHVDRKTNQISIDLIPETLRLTTFKQAKVGGKINYEIDQMTRTMVDTLENIYLRQNEN